MPYSDLYKDQAHQKLGTAGRMAMKLDNISSLIFSIAVVVVLIMVAVAILYFFIGHVAGFYSVSQAAG